MTINIVMNSPKIMCLKIVFFFRTHILWNMLSLQIKIVENYELFKKNLKAIFLSNTFPEKEH